MKERLLLAQSRPTKTSPQVDRQKTRKRIGGNGTKNLLLNLPRASDRNLETPGGDNREGHGARTLTSPEMGKEKRSRRNKGRDENRRPNAQRRTQTKGEDRREQKRPPNKPTSIRQEAPSTGMQPEKTRRKRNAAKRGTTPSPRFGGRVSPGVHLRPVENQVTEKLDEKDPAKKRFQRPDPWEQTRGKQGRRGRNRSRPSGGHQNPCPRWPRWHFKDGQSARDTQERKNFTATNEKRLWAGDDELAWQACESILCQEKRLENSGKGRMGAGPQGCAVKHERKKSISLNKKRVGGWVSGRSKFIGAPKKKKKTKPPTQTQNLRSRQCRQKVEKGKKKRTG